MDAVGGAVAQLADAVYEAARAVDRRNAIDLGTEVKDALTAGKVSTNRDCSLTKLIVGRDNRIRLSPDLNRAAGKIDAHVLAGRIVETLLAANIRLVCLEAPNERDAAGLLVQGAKLSCERVPH